MRARKGWLATGSVIVLSIAAVSWWRSERAAGDAADNQAETREPPSESRGDATAGAASPAPTLVIGEYRADTAGLPPIYAPLSSQVPELRTAAARGNATAACRLAVIGLRCGTARAFRFAASSPPDEAKRREMEDSVRARYGSVSLEALPKRYRAYAQRQLDTMAITEMDGFAESRALGERCAGAPPIGNDEIVSALRQAALAGEPNSMVRYASGLWFTELSMATVGLGFSHRGPGMDWLRSPGFDQWRRDAAAVRNAGLRRGDPEMLYLAFAFADVSGLRPLEPADPVESAAALRAYAALIGGHSPESTRALGLSEAQAAEADRLADAWASRGRDRGRRAEDVADLRLGLEDSACD
jgi:hypothetical protein